MKIQNNVEIMPESCYNLYEVNSMKAYYENPRESHNRIGVSKSYDFPYHFHTAVEFIYIISGREEVMVNGRSMVLESGGASIAFPYQAHGYRKIAEGEKFYFIVPASILEFTGKNLSRTVPEIPFFQYTGDDRLFFESLMVSLMNDVKSGRALADHDSAVRSDEVIKVEVNADLREYYTEIIRAMILFHLEHTGYSENAEQSSGDQLFQRIMLYLDAHYDDCDFSTEKAAREIGISTQYMSLLVRRSTGCTLTEHLRNLRIAKARRLLCRTDMSVSQIALESGFSSIRTFNRVFADAIGKTPRDFRLSGIWD